MQILKGRTSSISDLAISSDSRFIAAGGSHGVHIWNIENPQERPVQLDTTDCHSLVFISPDIITWKSFRLIKVYHASELRELAFSTSIEPAAIAFMPNHDQFVEMTDSGIALHKWSLDKNVLYTDFMSAFLIGLDAVDMVFSPDSRLLCATNQSSRNLMIHDCRTYNLVTNIEIPRNAESYRYFFSHDNSHIYAIHQHRISRFSCETANRELFVSHPKKKHFRHLAVHPSGEFLGVVNTDNSINFYSTTSGEYLKSYQWNIGQLTCIAFTPDHLRCAVAGTLGKVLLFDLE
jgi:WD40 repeat protein